MREILKKRGWKTIKKLLEFFVLTASLLFVLKYLLNGWPDIASKLEDIQPIYIVFSWILFAVFFGVRFLAWKSLIKGFGGEISL